MHEIKKSSFKLIDKSFTDNAGNNPTIIDDGFGNLYALNANSNFGTLTASSAGENNSISSSETVMGKIPFLKQLLKKTLIAICIFIYKLS